MYWLHQTLLLQINHKPGHRVTFTSVTAGLLCHVSSTVAINSLVCWKRSQSGALEGWFSQGQIWACGSIGLQGLVLSCKRNLTKPWDFLKTEDRHKTKICAQDVHCCVFHEFVVLAQVYNKGSLLLHWIFTTVQKVLRWTKLHVCICACAMLE